MLRGAAGDHSVSFHQKPDETQLLDVIPSTTIEAMFYSGVKNAPPPAPNAGCPAPAARAATAAPQPKPVVTPADSANSARTDLGAACERTFHAGAAKTSAG